jgi:endonuclease/exonuclease/phosphatase family metal-dependent hydrolase
VLVSWNVHVGGGDVERFVSDLETGRFTAGREVQHFVLLLQEAVRASGVPPVVPPGALAASRIGSNHSLKLHDIERVAHTLSLSVLYVPSMRNGGETRAEEEPTDRGNAILSSVPMSEPLAIELPSERQRRVAVAARIELQTPTIVLPVTVANVHLDALGPRRTLWLFGARSARTAQATSLAGALPPGPLIVGGDLNTWWGPEEPAVRALRDLLHSTPVIPRGATSSGGFLLDYFFYRLAAGWQMHVMQVPARYGSDHHPVIGWLSMNEWQGSRSRSIVR